MPVGPFMCCLVLGPLSRPVTDFAFNIIRIYRDLDFKLSRFVICLTMEFWTVPSFPLWYLIVQ